MFPDTKLCCTVAVAPPLTWMPFWAISAVGPMPRIRLCAISAEDPLLLTVGPFFW